MNRWLREIASLDPERDAQRIVFIDASLEFPWDTQRSLELAFYRTFAVPSIAELLDSTGEFTGRAQKRYDDTQLLISAFSEFGYDSDFGKRAIRRMNQIHGRFEIANEDYLYVLSAMVLEPLRWNERFTRTEAGVRLAHAQRDVFLAWFPWLPHAVGARAISALLEERVVQALGLVQPSAAERRVAEAGLRARGLALRALPPRRRPRLRTTTKRRSYPRGYAIEELGPRG